MDSIYIFLLGILFIAALVDLSVGVSNDAVNFINSAIGSRAASFKTILIIASFGIIFGALSSSGLMELAKKGFFNPNVFTFEEVMVIFVAVMITDILLLDIFNTFGMPTSTTVSIVFEILGAAVILSFVKIFNQNDNINAIWDYINTKKAFSIVSGIFISVIVAFFSGMFIQYLSRALFSFNYERRLKDFGPIWAGIACASLTYFLFFKALGKSTSELRELLYIDILKEEKWLFFFVSAALFSLIMYVLLYLKVNILKVIVLYGTFSLAMAFAGNDLINFIGVPAAGFQAYEFWQASGQAANSFLMTDLASSKTINPLVLLIAGLIMVLTLWLSKKSRSVTETEVNLARQEEGEERFNPNLISRTVVHLFKGIGSILSSLIPDFILKKVEKNFEPFETENAPAFDLIRASVNLTVASVLIANATDLKLPLSTTYVTFMVAMGSSLSDRAWGRESAVYRVAGVLNVIGGWFLTAIVAFTFAGLFAFLIYKFEIWAVLLLVVLAVTALVKSSLFQKKKDKLKEKEQQLQTIDINDLDTTYRTLLAEILTVTLATKEIYSSLIKSIVIEESKGVQQAKEQYKNLSEDFYTINNNLFKLLKKVKNPDSTYAKLYLLAYDYMNDMMIALGNITKSCDKHIKNNHKPLRPKQVERINKLMNEMSDFLEKTALIFSSANFSNLSQIENDKNIILNTIDHNIDRQIEGVAEKRYGAKNSALYFSILLESKGIARDATHLTNLFSKMLIDQRGV